MNTAFLGHNWTTTISPLQLDLTPFIKDGDENIVYYLLYTEVGYACALFSLNNRLFT